MTLEELNSFGQFSELPHFDGNDRTATVPKPDPPMLVCSGMTTSEADTFLSEGKTPKYVEKHTADDGSVGYEVVFWFDPFAERRMNIQRDSNQMETNVVLELKPDGVKFRTVENNVPASV